jgi:integrase
VALETAIQQLRDSGVPRRTQMTVGEFLDDWLKDQNGKIRETTIYSYRIAVERMRPHVGRTKLQALTPAMVQLLYRTLLESGGDGGKALAPKTVRNTHVVLRKALADAVKLEYVHRNVAASVSPPSGARPVMQTWSSENMRDFLEVAEGDRLYALFVLLATTGMRRGEVVGLRWRDVDLDDAQLAVAHTITTVGSKTLIAGPPKTPRSRRSIFLDEATVRVLREHRQRQKDERAVAGELWNNEMGLVFTDELGGPVHPDRVGAEFRRLAKQADVPPIRLHDLRHTFATLALKAGMHPKLVSERLGHATVGVTLDLYSHVTQSIARDSASIVSSQFLR